MTDTTGDQPDGYTREQPPCNLASGDARFRLAYRPPLDWDGLLAYFAGRAIDGVEKVSGDGYHRTVALLDRHGQLRSGCLSVAPASAGDALTLTLSSSLAEVIPECLARVRALFDLDAEPQRISQSLGRLAADCPGLRIPGA